MRDPRAICVVAICFLGTCVLPCRAFSLGALASAQNRAFLSHVSTGAVDASCFHTNRGGRKSRMQAASSLSLLDCKSGGGAEFVCDNLPASAVLPSLVVFDLDHTLWTPELYQLRKLKGYSDASGPGPVPEKDVRLFDGAKNALLELAVADRWKDSQLAVASRTNKGPWARILLKQFQVNGKTLDDLIPYQEIYSSAKTRHFEALHKRTGVKYEDMLFFDDAKAGKWGNCEPVAKMGVMSAHCPDGLTDAVWKNALEEFAAAKAAGGGKRMGKVLDAPGGSTAARPGPQTATITKWNDDRAFGFVALSDKTEVFFHRSAVAGSVSLARGSKVEVEVGSGRNGKLQCTSVALLGGGGSSRSDMQAEGTTGAAGECIDIECFSMNQPFAGAMMSDEPTLCRCEHARISSVRACSHLPSASSRASSHRPARPHAFTWQCRILALFVPALQLCARM